MICFLADFPGVDNGRFLVLDEGVRGVHVMLSLPPFLHKEKAEETVQQIFVSLLYDMWSVLF